MADAACTAPTGNNARCSHGAGRRVATGEGWAPACAWEEPLQYRMRAGTVIYAGPWFNTVHGWRWPAIKTVSYWRELPPHLCEKHMQYQLRVEGEGGLQAQPPRVEGLHAAAMVLAANTYIPAPGKVCPSALNTKRYRQYFVQGGSAADRHASCASNAFDRHKVHPATSAHNALQAVPMS